MAAPFVLDFPLLFLSPHEAAVVDALVAVIIPSEPGSPGAHEAGVVEYIDRGLAGFLRDLQPVYRQGLRLLAEVTTELTGAADLVELDDEARRRVVARLDRLRHDDPTDPAGRFYAIVREHTIQGFFGDPAHGGNRDLAGWRLVGFPGAQWGYTPEQMAPGVDARSIPMVTIGDLYTRIGEQR